MEQDNNILLDQVTLDSTYQLRTKIKYLQDNKDKLELALNQFTQNLQIMRQINRQLTKNHIQFNESFLLNKLQQQNQYLQLSNNRLIEQNKSLQSQILMLKQIIQQSQNEYKIILKQNEIKIIQLRRSIQFKQSCIQNLENNKQLLITNNYGNIPSSNVNLLFFNQLDSYKLIIKQLELKNNKLEQELKKKNQKIQTIQKEKQIIDNLLSTSIGFYQFKMIFKEKFINKNIRLSSQNKVDIFVDIFSTSKKYKDNIKNQNQIKNKSINQSTTSTLTSQFNQSNNASNFHSYNNNINNGPQIIKIKDELKKKTTELNKLSQVYIKQRQERKSLEVKLQAIINSNKSYQKKRQANHLEVKYYQQVSLQLIKSVENRLGKEEFETGIKRIRSYSKQKTQIEKIIQNGKLKIIQSSKNHQIKQIKKDYFLQAKRELDTKLKNKVILKINKRQYKNSPKLKRSFSVILPFIYESQQNYASIHEKKNKSGKVTNKQKITQVQGFGSKKKILQEKENTPNQLNDFSQMLSLGPNGEFFDDETFLITPPAKVVSYAERKKNKAKTTLGLDPHQVTIIRENLL